ncbi:hypothetical protein SAMN05660874_01089 [Saccharopolyspora flava]|uniref:Uncharacterized protein n=1 Tax=Saccharopolyspora flava TaxID=95161 RepID=A0A1I6PTC4_9PSEU|nr:hypothetical protein SAMN05660874_01089 [Saccharopolyspora flava]
MTGKRHFAQDSVTGVGRTAHNAVQPAPRSVTIFTFRRWSRLEAT